MHPNPRLSELFRLVSQIPEGRCTAYSALGRALDRPVSGFLVGKWMDQCPEGLPWWRVVKRDGSIATDQKSPEAGLKQRQLLKDEGVPFTEDRVQVDIVWWEPL